MGTLLLAGVLCCFQAADDQLLRQLDADFEDLLKNEKDVLPLRKAARFLEQTNQSDRWTDYKQAVGILRRTRAKAGIPLLLKYMVKHASLSTGHVTIQEYTDALAILAGKDIANPYRHVADREKPVRDAVEELVNTWWLPNREKISTDFDAMSKEQMEVVADRLLEKARKSLSHRLTPNGIEGEVTAYRVYHLLYYDILSHSIEDRPGWEAAELRPAMVPSLLRPAGYQEHPPETPRRDWHPVPYAAIPMLASMRKNGAAPTLDKIADDPQQNSATRLTCILALYSAGEELNTPALLSILKTEQKLEYRLLAILALRYSRDLRPAGKKLMELMDDPNGEIRTAAICALRGPRPQPALPKLKNVIDDLNTPQAMVFVFDVIGEFKTREACEILAGFLAAALEDPRKAKYVSNALGAFQTATGKRFRSAGAHDDAYYREKAAEAVTWWKTQGRRLYGPRPEP